MRRLGVIAGVLALALVGLGGWWIYGPHDMVGHAAGQGAAMGQVSVPELSVGGRAGETLFEANCSSCHGLDAAGSDQGPPLVHRIYEPSHHGDPAFYRAALLGVQAHHWRFGNMPPVEGVSEQDVGMIVRYVRELQRANGIF
ncbi:MAG: cytochrome c [Thalassobaculaceae bacterium]